MNSEFVRLCDRLLLEPLNSWRRQCSFVGIIGGFLLTSWLHQFSATFGAELIPRVCLLLGSTLGLGVAFALFHSHWARNLTQISRNLIQSILHWGLAAWTICLPWLTGWAARSVGTIDAATLSLPVFQFLTLGLAAVFLVTVPVTALTARLLLPSAADMHPGRAAAPPGEIGNFLIAVAGGVVLTIFFASWGAGIHHTAMVAALAGAVYEAVVVSRLYRQPSILAEVTALDTSSQSAVQKTESPDGAAPRFSRGLSLLSATAAGLSVAWIGRVVHQLVPATEWLILLRIAAFLAAAGIAWRWQTRHTLVQKDRHESFCRQSLAMLALWPVVLTAAFPLLIDGMLWVNAYVSQLTWLILIQALVVTLAIAPLGLVMGSVTQVVSAESLGPSRLGVGAALAAFAAAYAVSAYWLIPIWGPASLSIAIACVCLVGALIGEVIRASSARSKRSHIAAVAVTALILGLFAPGNYVPALSARLLFSSRIFSAVRAGTARDLLPYLDEARCAAVIEGNDGTYTAWKYCGVQYQVRESGIPKAILSTDHAVCPQFSTPVMQAVIPLVLHPQPRQVMLLGLGGGTSLETCLAFPVQSVVCAEPDQVLSEFLNSLTPELATEAPLKDERVTLRHIAPTLAVLDHTQSFDVILCHADQPALWKSGPTYTREFYFRAAACLSEHGIFCQQFQFVDFAADSVQELSATWRSAFRHVMAMETAPGEMILLGTNSADGLLRDDLVEAFQAPHVRRVLAWTGWDWSKPFNVPAYSDQGMGRIAESGARRGNTAANGKLALALPWDVLRWGDKYTGMRSVLDPEIERLWDWSSAGEPDPDVGRRVSEVAAQEDLIRRYPDEYWMYRKAVREQIVERPRSLVQQIQQASFERTMHPDDARRLKYFEALGKANERAKPDPGVIRKISEFASPYDPLITYFLHQEVADLYRRSAEPAYADELAHRLYAVFYAVPGDRSVRNISAAITLLVQHPEAVPEPRRRWDLLSALQQTLQARWEARGTVSPTSSRIVLNDIEISLEAIEASLPVMRELTLEAGLENYDWEQREELLERWLIRPLHTYHGQLLPYHLKTQKRVAELIRKRQENGEQE